LFDAGAKGFLASPGKHVVAHRLPPLALLQHEVLNSLPQLRNVSGRASQAPTWSPSCPAAIDPSGGPIAIGSPRSLAIRSQEALEAVSLGYNGPSSWCSPRGLPRTRARASSTFERSTAIHLVVMAPPRIGSPGASAPASLRCCGNRSGRLARVASS